MRGAWTTSAAAIITGGCFYYFGSLAQLTTLLAGCYAFNVLTISGGTFLGAKTPVHWLASKSETNSPMVGTSGSASERIAVDTAVADVVDFVLALHGGGCVRSAQDHDGGRARGRRRVRRDCEEEAVCAARCRRRRPISDARLICLRISGCAPRSSLFRDPGISRVLARSTPNKPTSLGGHQ